MAGSDTIALSDGLYNLFIIAKFLAQEASRESRWSPGFAMQISSVEPAQGLKKFGNFEHGRLPIWTRAGVTSGIYP